MKSKPKPGPGRRLAANVKYLAERAELLRQTRSLFDRNGFLEVQPPCLMRDCVVDAYLDPIVVQSEQCGLSHPELPEAFYLQTSPESAMKRMLADGAPSIYSLGPVFRSGEAGRLHNIEFTMLEWYEVGGDFDSAIRWTADYVNTMLDRQGVQLVSYREAFQQYVAIDPIEADVGHLYEAVAETDATLADSLRDDRDQLLDVLMSTHVAPRLGHASPVALTEYPISQAALAKPSKNDGRCAARFELFVDGIEIANGYDELLNPDVLVDRSNRNNQVRELHGRTPLNVETTLVNAMRQGLPPCSGVALGVDRLLMIRVGAKAIEDVIPFSIFNA